MRSGARYAVEIPGLLLAVVFCGCAPTVTVDDARGTTSAGQGGATATATSSSSGQGGATSTAGSGSSTTNSTSSSSGQGGGTSSSSSSGGGGGLGCPPAAVVGINSDTVQVASVDPATGILTVLGPAPTASLLIGFSAYDHATKRIYEFGEGELYALDGVTGVLLFTTPLAMQTFNQLYNPIVNDSGQIVVLRLGNPTGTATLDPVTGSLTDLAATPYNDGFGQAMRAFDPTTNRVYQFGNFFVLTIDGATGSVLANTPLTDKNFWNPVVNNAGEIIGVNGESPQHIARLDPATGVVTNLAPYSGEAEMGGMTFDPCTNRMYQFYGYKVATIDGTTGATIATVTMAQQNFLNFQAVW